MLSPKKHPFYVLLVVTIDTLMILVSFYLAYWVRFFGHFIPLHKGIPSPEYYLRMIIVVTPIFLLIFRWYRLYQPERNIRRIQELLNVIKAVSFGAVVLMALTFIYREFSYSRMVLFFAWLISTFLCCLGRYFLIQFEYFIRRNKDRDNVLIIGMNRNSRNLIQWAKENPHYGQNVIGILTHHNSHEGKHVEGVPIIGDIKDLDEVFATQHLDEVIVTEPTISREVATELMMKCENKMISFKLVADFYGLITHHVDVEYVSNVPLLGLKALPLDDVGHRLIKRLFDIFVSGLSLILLLPILILISVVIKMCDGDPILYTQERVGQDEKLFNLYKFRTMPTDAETKTGPVWAKPGDERVTPVGKFLRQTNLDELPQLWNVLIGDMSLVGPRPERPHFVKQFRDQIPRYMTRHKIKSGITGWAQIHGLRGNTSLEERIKYDLYYLENWTLMMDIEILFATIFAFKNAY